MKLLPMIAAAALMTTPALAATKHAVAKSVATKVAARNWLGTVVATPEGGFRIGNPAAKVKLIEYGSLTCSHCRDFHAASGADLRAKYIATGKLSFEYRNFVRNGLDFSASILAACDGPSKFFGRIDSLFAKQDDWMKPFVDMSPEAAAKVAALPADAQVAGLAKAGGLDVFMQTRGMTPARIDQCLADKTAQERLAAMRKVAVDTYELDGTPMFLINGQRQTIDSFGQVRGVVSWAELEPKIVAALR